MRYENNIAKEPHFPLKIIEQDDAPLACSGTVFEGIGKAEQ